MIAAGASAASSIDGLGIRLRVRGSSVSMNPVSRNSPLSPIRHEIPSVGSAIENTTVQPPLWRENNSIRALMESFESAMRGTHTGGRARNFFRTPGGFFLFGGGFLTPPVQQNRSANLCAKT